MTVRSTRAAFCISLNLDSRKVSEIPMLEFGGGEQRRNKEIGDSIDGHTPVVLKVHVHLVVHTLVQALPYRRKVSENSRYRHEFSIMMNQVYTILEL